MRVLITGSSGLIGSALAKYLVPAGYKVTKLVRPGGPVGAGYAMWDPANDKVELDALAGHDAVIHMAGENLAARRWTAEFKKKVRDSRVDSTALLCRSLRQLDKPPEVAIFASGIIGDEDDSTAPTGFLAECRRDWEAASQGLDNTPIRTVRLRIGMVLSKEGGALAKMLTPFKLGLGGRLGSGKQYMSWIGLVDLIRITRFLIETESISGIVNAVSPNPVTNTEFTRTLAEVLKRPAVIPVPALALKLLLGTEMANELALASSRTFPSKLIDSGFKFRHSKLKDALADELKS